MKVCLVNTLYYPNNVGGAERSVQFLAEALVQGGHEAIVISLVPQHGISSVVHNGVKVYTLGHCLLPWPFRDGGVPWLLKPYYFVLDSYYNPFICSSVRKILAQERPDLVHTNNIFGFSPQIWKIIKRMGLPLIHTLRDYSLLCTRSTMWKNGENCQKQCLPCRIHSRPRKTLSRLVDGVVSISEFLLAKHQVRKLFANVSISSVIYNSHSSDDKSSTLLSASDQRQPMCLGYLGRLESEKGLDLLLEAFNVATKQMNCRLLIGGEGTEAYKCAIKRKYSHSPGIEFHGFVKPQNILEKIDILIVPSLWDEPLGRVIFEAYQYGVPVIGASRGGIPEIIEENKTGYLFDPVTPDSLVEKLIYACSNPQKIRSMKPACQEMAKKFSPDFIANQYLKIYQAVALQQLPASENSRPS